MSGDAKKPVGFGRDLGFYELALTKEDHDRLTKNRRRNLTDGPIGSRTTKAIPTADESVGNYATKKEDQ